MQAKKTFLISVLILLVGVASTVLIFSTEPEAKREAATKRTAMLVDVIPAEAGDFRPIINVMGTVKAEKHISLRPRVSGQIIARGKNFVPGAYVKRGEVLLQVDPSDYENLLAQRKSELAQAVTAMQIEMGEQAIAERDYKQLNRNLSDMQKSLVLREPQLSAAKAKVAAAKAAVTQAELNLERTSIKASFDAQVLSRLVNVGSQITPSDELAQLIGLDTYWVEATVPLAKLRWLKASDSTSGNDVQIRNRTAWPAGEFRSGKIHSIIGELEGQTRMARVLIAVEDPLATREENKSLMPLMVGSYVECQITAEPLNNVVRLSRQYVRKNDTAWVMENNALSIRELDIAFQDADHAYIENGVSTGEQIVVSSLSRISEGAELRIQGEQKQ